MIPQTEYCSRCMYHRIAHATIEAVQMGMIHTPQIVRLVHEHSKKLTDQKMHKIINHPGGHSDAILKNNPHECADGDIACRDG